MPALRFDLTAKESMGAAYVISLFGLQDKAFDLTGIDVVFSVQTAIGSGGTVQFSYTEADVAKLQVSLPRTQGKIIVSIPKSDLTGLTAGDTLVYGVFSSADCRLLLWGNFTIESGFKCPPT